MRAIAREAGSGELTTSRWEAIYAQMSKEMVRDGETGLLVEPEDATALAAALARLAGDPDLRQRLGAAGPAHVAERNAPAKMVDAYVALYDEVLGGADVSAAPRTAPPRS